MNTRFSIQLVVLIAVGFFVHPSHAQMGHPFIGMEIDGSADVAELDALEAALPESIGSWTRAATNAFRLAGEPIPVAEALYEHNGRALAVAIADLQAVQHDFIEEWQQLAAEGHARETSFGEVPGFEGTGVSDDVAPPHGVMAFINDRFQLNIAEMDESLRSVADFSELAEEELQSMIDRARTAMQALDLETLAAEALGRTPPAAENEGIAESTFSAAPEGFEAYATDWPSTRVSLVYPQGWTLVNLHERTDFMPVLSIMRSADAAEAIYGTDEAPSTELEGRLAAPDNVIVDVSFTGMDASRMSALDFLASIDAPPINDPYVIDPPASVTIEGRDAAVVTVRGSDSDGRALILHQWIVESGGQLLAVHAFLPVEERAAIEPVLRTILSSIELSPR